MVFFHFIYIPYPTEEFQNRRIKKCAEAQMRIQEISDNLKQKQEELDVSNYVTKITCRLDFTLSFVSFSVFQEIDSQLEPENALTPLEKLRQEMEEDVGKIRSNYFTMFLLLTYIVLPVSSDFPSLLLANLSMC